MSVRLAEGSPTLGGLIDRQIAHSGPMSVAAYMQLCLGHPTLGYYRRAKAIGRTGDFITAPEISQMFGEMIGLWLALLAPQFPGQAFELAELGPGRGTLIADALRTLARTAPEAAITGPTLIEISDVLRAEQMRRLAGFTPSWIETVQDIDPEGPPLIMVANEFFDALPIHQYLKQNGQWHERLIGLRDGQRIWGLDPTPLPIHSLPASVRDAEDGAIWETALQAASVMDVLAERLKARGGVLLVIDYGYEKTATGDTFQAVAAHAYADPLDEPGQADLTAHIDFEALAAPARALGLEAFPLLTQRDFLCALGIESRTAALMHTHPTRADEFTQASNRLIGPDRMGHLFKCLCVGTSGLVPYPFATLPEPAP